VVAHACHLSYVWEKVVGSRSRPALDKNSKHYLKITKAERCRSVTQVVQCLADACWGERERERERERETERERQTQPAYFWQLLYTANQY
jgi:hypothetical protein